MIHAPGRPTAWVLRPTVAFSIAYLGACAMGFLWLLATLRPPDERGVSLIPTGLLVAGSLANAAWLVALAGSAVRCRRDVEPPLRRAQLVGVGLSALAVVLVEVGLLLAHDPWILD